MTRALDDSGRGLEGAPGVPGDSLESGAHGGVPGGRWNTPRRGSYRPGARERAPRFSFPRQLLFPALALTAALGGLFFWTFARMWERWNNPHGYYSHGPLILPIALITVWLIVRRRGLPMKSVRSSRFAGIALLAGAVLLHLLSMYARVTFVSGLMLLPVLGGFALYLGGWRMFGRLWFPIAFLAFMVPLPDPVIGEINFRLKMFAAEAATAIVNGLGVPAYLRGAEIFLQKGRTLAVEDACSGLRSLISLLAFATLFVYACKLRGYKRLMLLAAAVPIALAANVVRIATLAMVADAGHAQLASPGGWVHDGMGFVVFIVAFCLMFLLEQVLTKLPGGRIATRGPLTGRR